MSLLLTLNIFYILDDVKNAEVRALYWKRERKVSLTDCKLNCFSLEYKPLPLYRNPHSECRPNNGILRYFGMKRAKNMCKNIAHNGIFINIVAFFLKEDLFMGFFCK